VEGAQALERGAGLAQADALADQLGQVELLFDLCCYANGRGESPVSVVTTSFDETL
jgi:hypothetical protein